ncbi:hypothetical protein HZY83_00650 [Gemella sp. GH3]|uniref:hypothetical protein n=1 Tax=unclassified Gemella TaxID=2624949 RepID=UPI0015D05905|nr:MULTISPECIES: hypothetical protein [unclassified Gemella]MBF0713219.1 hypothetical protein [Gemella sp. GH3.1]NYS50171.1 hypothetical protein [Gemella sp. GH3]
MKNIKYFVIAVFLLILQGCSNNADKMSSEEANNIISSINAETLEKIEIDSNNSLLLYVNKEFITKEDFDNIISTIKVGNSNGLSAFKKDNVSEKISNIQVVSKNGNKATFKTGNVDDIKFNIENNKYSDNYVKETFNELSQIIIRFNELAGRIEVDLKQNNLNDARVDEFNKTYTKLNKSIEKANLLTSENTNFDNLSQILDKVKVVESNINTIKQSVEKGVSTGQSNFINNSYLYINDLDKIAREIANL